MSGEIAQFTGADVIRVLTPVPAPDVLREAPTQTQERDFKKAMEELTATATEIRRLETELATRFRDLNELQAELLAMGMSINPHFGPIISAARSRFNGDPFWDRDQR